MQGSCAEVDWEGAGPHLVDVRRVGGILRVQQHLARLLVLAVDVRRARGHEAVVVREEDVLARLRAEDLGVRGDGGGEHLGNGDPVRPVAQHQHPVVLQGDAGVCLCAERRRERRRRQPLVVIRKAGEPHPAPLPTSRTPLPQLASPGLTATPERGGARTRIARAAAWWCGIACPRRTASC